MSASTRLHVRVAPGASRPGIVGRYGTAWKVLDIAEIERRLTSASGPAA